MCRTDDEPRQQKLRALAKRLDRVRGDLTDDAFAELLADMLRTAERFAEIDANPGARRTPDLTPWERKRLGRIL